jgi:hypothetical protein
VGCVLASNIFFPVPDKLLLERDPEVDLSELPWLRAKALAEGRDDEWKPMTEEEVERLAEDYAQRMAKHLGPRFVRSPEIAAKAIVKLAPRGAVQIAQALQDELGLGMEEDEDVDF